MADQNDNPYAPPRDPAGTHVTEWGTAPLPREFRCRAGLRWMQFVFLFGAFLTAIVPIWINYRYITPVTPMHLAFWGIWLILPIQLVLQSLSFYRMAGVTLVFEENALVYRHRGGERRLALDKFTFLEPGRSFSGVLRIRVANEDLKLPVHVENVSQLVRLLKAALDARGLAQIYDRDRLFRFFKTTASADQSVQRFKEGLVWKMLLATGFAGVAGGLLALVRGAGQIEAAIWIGASAFWPMIVCAVAEQIILSRFKRDADKNSFTCAPIEPVWARSVHRKALVVGAVLYAATASAASFI